MRGRFFGGEMSTDYTDRCGNCHSRMEKEDRYCKICGTKRGDGSFNPYSESFECIYGPMPIARLHTCSVCGWSWKTELMIDEQRYCPRCGGTAPIKEELPEENLQPEDDLLQPELTLQRLDNSLQLHFRDFPCVVGRGMHHDVLPDTSVSRKHFSLTFQDGKFFITDLNSKNGTLINQKQIPADKMYQIH